MVVQDIRAQDSEELRWLRAGWLKSIRERTSTYSVVTVTLVLLFGVLGIFEIFEDDITLFEQIITIFTMVVCFAIFAMVAIGGIELARWTGIVLIIGHALLSAYYLGFSDERQNAVAALQELPMLAMYFSWFYGARAARIGESVIVIVVGAAALFGPFTGQGGLLGPVNLLGAGLFTWLCLEAGLFVRHRIRMESHTDELTGALNRRGFITKAQMELNRSQRTGRPLSIALLDLDKFKAINDESGHAAGDYVLKSLAAQWMTLSRPTDIVGRLGGDEFALLMPETDAAGARALMLRLREFASHPWSWGIAQLGPDETIEEAVARADAEMYGDKHR